MSICDDKISTGLSTLEAQELFRELLAQKCKEQKYQEFLENYSQFIPREFVQNHGVHLQLALRKLALSNDYKMDFFYLSKSSDDWNGVLIEIEKPESQFFSGDNFHPDFVKALQQMNKWRAWFDDVNNHNHFYNSTLHSIRVPLGYKPCITKYVLVFGRRSEYEENAQRSRLVRGQEREDFKIVSYDSILDHPHLDELYVGIRNNTTINILTDHFIGDTLFAWTDPNQLQITQRLKNDAEAKKSQWRSRGVDKRFHMEDKLGKIVVFTP